MAGVIKLSIFVILFNILTITGESVHINELLDTRRLTVVSVQPMDDLTSRQVTAAVRIAIHDWQSSNNDRASRNVTIISNDLYVSKLGDSTDYFDEYLTRVVDVSSVAAIGMPAAAMIDLLAATLAQLEAPAITTKMSPRKKWTDVYYNTLLFAGPTNDQMAWTVKDLFQHYSWLSRVCAIYSNEFSSLTALQNFLLILAPIYSIEVATSVVVNFDGVDSLSETTLEELARLKTQCSKYIVGLNEPELLPVLEAAQRHSLIEVGTAWVFLDFITAPNLLHELVLKHMDGALIIRPRVPDGNGHRFQQLAAKLRRFHSNDCSSADVDCISLETVYAYEAVLQLSQVLAAWSQSLQQNIAQERMALHANLKLLENQNGLELMRLLHQAKWNGILNHKASFRAQPPQFGYDLFNLRDQKLVWIGNWSTTVNGNQLSELKSIRWPGPSHSIPRPAPSFDSSRALKILLREGRPFTYLLKKGKQNLTNDDFAGVAVDVLREVAWTVGLNYTLHYWNGTYDSMIETACDAGNDYDMAIGSLTVTAKRARFCSFTRTIFYSGLRMLVKRPAELKSGLWDFLKPYHWTVWLAILFTVLTSAVVIYILDPNGIRADSAGNVVTDAVIFSATVFMSVHEADAITRKWAQIFLIFLQFAMLILLSSYTANMASFLSSKHEESPITTYTDIWNKRVAVRPGTANYPYVKNELGIRSSNLVHVMDPQEAVLRLRSNEADVFIADVPVLDVQASINCDLIVQGHLIAVQEYAFVVPRNFSLLRKINRAMTKAVEHDLVDDSYRKHQKLNVDCPPYSQGDKVKPLSLSNLGSLFAIIFLFSIPLTGLKIWSRVNRWKRPKLPMRPISESSTISFEKYFAHPKPRRESVGARLSSTFINPLFNLFNQSQYVTQPSKYPVSNQH